MLDEQQFRSHSEQALEELKRALILAEEDGDFEVEEQGGVLQIAFEEPPGKFVVTPNTPIRQIWISALATSYKLDWSESQSAFVLEKTGENLKKLMARLINQQLGDETVKLG